MNIRKTAVLAAAALLLPLGLAACSSDKESEAEAPATETESEEAQTDTEVEKIGGSLVIYTPNEQTMLDALIPVFEDESGVKVEIVTAGTGELYQRIRSEANAPQADVMFGGSSAMAVENSDLWEEYISPNNDDMLPLGQNIDGICTPYQADGSNLLVNTNEGTPFDITGYESLLDPGLKGKIAFGDPTSSSSAFAQLTNILLAMGGYESDEAWDYVEQLVAQLDGKVIGGSTQVAQDTANGEFYVALTYEPLSVNFEKAGSPVEIVYPSEGAVFLPAGSQIIKNANNLEQAKAFLDFITSEQGQEIIANDTSGRPLRDGVNSPYLTPLQDIHTLDEDAVWVTEHRDEIVARYQSLLENA